MKFISLKSTMVNECISKYPIIHIHKLYIKIRGTEHGVQNTSKD